MSKFKKALKSVAKVIANVVPDKLDPIVKIGLAFVPGVGPALSAAYSAADAYGNGASLGNALGQGVKSYAISQVAGAASRSLGITSSGNDLTDALGQTKGEGILGLGSGTSQAAQTLGTTAASAATSGASSGAADGLSGADKAFISAAKASASGPLPSVGTITDGASSSGGGLFSFGNIAKGAAAISSVASAATAFGTKPEAPVPPSSNTSSVDNSKQIADDAAAAAEEERRKRGGRSSNIFTSPLGLSNGKSAAAQLLG